MIRKQEDEDDEMPRRIWEAVEAKIGEVGMAEAKRRRGKRRSREKIGRVGKEEENGRDKKNSRGMGNLG